MPEDRKLYLNTKYFWQVAVISDGYNDEVVSEVYSFTTIDNGQAITTQPSSQPINKTSP